MPWEVPITVDGLEYPVRFNTEGEPTQTDIDEAVRKITAQREDKPLFDLSDTLSATGRAFTSLGTTVPASLSQAWSGLENPWKRSEGYLQRQQEMRALQEEMAAAEEGAAKAGDASSVSSAIREATPSLGFSGATLFPSLAAGAGTALATRSPTLSRMAAAGTSAVVAYRMAGAQFLDDARDRINAFFQENFNRPPTEQEQEEAYQEILPLAQKFGAAEAGPEALGNLALGGAGKYIRRALGGKSGIVDMATNALGKVTGSKAILAGVGGALGEIGTEAVTKVEQDRIQKQFEEGTMKGQSPDAVKLPDRTLGDYAQAFTDVAPSTLALTGLMGAAGLAPTALSKGYQAIRPPTVATPPPAQPAAAPGTAAPDVAANVAATDEGEVAPTATPDVGTPVTLDGQNYTISIPPESTIAPETVAGFYDDPDTLRALADRGDIRLEQVITPAETVDTTPLNDNLAVSAALAPETVAAVAEATAEEPIPPAAVTAAQETPVAPAESDGGSLGSFERTAGGSIPAVTEPTVPQTPDVSSPEIGAAADPFAAVEQPQERQIADEDRAEFEEFQELLSRRGPARSKVKGVSFTKKDEARFQELGAKHGHYLFDRVNPQEDPVVGEDINGSPIQQSATGTYYTVEDGRVRTGPSFKEDPGFVREQNELLKRRSPQPATEPPTPPTNAPAPQIVETGVPAKPAKGTRRRKTPQASTGDQLPSPEGSVEQARKFALEDALTEAEGKKAVRLTDADSPSRSVIVARDPEDPQSWRATLFQGDEPVRHELFSTQRNAVSWVFGEEDTQSGNWQVQRKPANAARRKEVSDALMAQLRGEGIEVSLQERALLRPKFEAGETVTFKVNGQPVIGTIQRVSGGGNATVTYNWNGKKDQEIVLRTSEIQRPVLALAEAPNYKYTQEQNTRKAARFGIPTEPGVVVNAAPVITSALERIASDTAMPPMLRAVARALQRQNYEGVDLRIVADGRLSYAGQYLAKNGRGVPEIELNMRAVGRGQTDAVATLLHELLHHVTLAKIRDPQGEIETQAVEALDTLRKRIKAYAGMQQKATKFSYELGAVDEFITALFTRPDFQDFIAGIPDTFVPGTPGSKFRSVLSEVFRIIAQLVTGQRVQKGGMLDQAFASSLALFETPQRTARGVGVDYSMADTDMTVPEIENLIRSFPLSDNDARVPNTSSIASSLSSYEELGVREVPIDFLIDTENPKWPTYFIGGADRTMELADLIEKNGMESPMILVWENERYPYVLEGSTRYDALQVLAAQKRKLPATVPALTVIDTSSARQSATDTAAPEIEPVFTPDEARAILTKRFGKAVADKFVIEVMAPRRMGNREVEVDAELRGGTISLNLKFMDNEDILVQKAEHEMAHAVYSDKKVQDAWRDLSASMPPDVRQRITERMKQAGYDPRVLNEEVLVRFFEEVRATTPPSKWKAFMDAVIDAFRRFFGAAPDERTARLAAARIIAAGEAAVARGLDPSKQAFGQSIATQRDYAFQRNLTGEAAEMKNLATIRPWKETVRLAREIIEPYKKADTSKDKMAGRREALQRLMTDTSIDPNVRAAGFMQLALETDTLASVAKTPEQQAAYDDFSSIPATGYGVLESSIDPASVKFDSVSQMMEAFSQAGRMLNTARLVAAMTPDGFIRKSERVRQKKVGEVTEQQFGTTPQKLLELMWNETAKAERDAVEKAKKEIKRRSPEAIAKAAIDRLNEMLAGPPRPRGKPSQVSELLRKHLYNPVEGFTDKLVALGVEKETADALDAVAATVRADLAKLEEANAVERLTKSLKPKTRAAKSAIPRLMRVLLEAGKTGAFDSKAFNDALAEAFNFPPMTAEQDAEIRRMVAEINKLPMGAARVDKQQELQNYVAMVQGIPARDVLLSAWYANILSGISTQAIGLVGNTMNTFLRSAMVAVTNPADFMAYVRGALGVGKDAGIAEVKAALQGRGQFKVGKLDDPQIANALEVLFRKGPTTPAEWVAYIASAATRLRYVFRVMSMIDAFYWNSAREGMYHLAASRTVRKMAKEKSMTKEEANAEFIRQLGGGPEVYEEELKAAEKALKDAGQPADMATMDRMAREAINRIREKENPEAVQAANRWADRMVLQQEPEGIGKLISALIRGIQGINVMGFPLGQMLVPFNKIVSNLFEQSLDYTGLGLVRGALGMHLSEARLDWSKGIIPGISPAEGAKMFSDVERRERAMAGFVGLTLSAAAYLAAKSHMDDDDDEVPFMLYAFGPSDKNKREQMPAGWVPFSIKVGDTYYRYAEWPLGMVLAGFAAALDAERYGNMKEKDAMDRIGYSAMLGLKGFMTQGVLSNVDTAIDALMFKATGKKYTDIPVNAAKGLIPAQGFLRDISSLFDNTKVSNDDVMSALLRDVPFAKSLGTKPQLNVFGEPVEMEGEAILRRFLTQRRPHPTADYLTRNKLYIPGMAETVDVGDYLPASERDRFKRRAMQMAAMDNGVFTPEQNYAFRKRAGELTKSAVERVMKQAPAIRTEEQRKAVQNLIDKQVALARRRAMVEAVPYQPSPAQ